MQDNYSDLEIILTFDAWVARHLKYRAMAQPGELASYYQIRPTKTGHFVITDELVIAKHETEQSHNEVSKPVLAGSPRRPTRRPQSHTRLNPPLIAAAILFNRLRPHRCTRKLRVRLCQTVADRLSRLPPEVQLCILEALPIWLGDRHIMTNWPQLAACWVGTLGGRLVSFFDQLASPDNLRFLGCFGTQSQRLSLYRPTSFDLHPTLRLKSEAFKWDPQSQHPFYGPSNLTAAKTNIVTSLEGFMIDYGSPDWNHDLEDEMQRLQQWAKVQEQWVHPVEGEWICHQCAAAFDPTSRLPILIPLGLIHEDIEIAHDDIPTGVDERARSTSNDSFTVEQIELLESDELAQVDDFLLLYPDEFDEIRRNMALFCKPTYFFGGGLSANSRTHSPQTYFKEGLTVAQCLREQGMDDGVCSHEKPKSALEEFTDLVGW